MPSITDIISSVQIPVLIIDPVIKNGKPVCDNRQRPLHYSGGFAVAFVFEVEEKKWMFRCWSADVGNIAERLRKVSLEIRNLNLDFLSDFIYENEGIIIDGQRYPTIRMPWVEGYKIKDYIYIHRKEPDCLLALSNAFLNMCKVMHKNHIAHGDLQHGNIIVDNAGNIHLIDYDSFYVPSLHGAKDFISGLPDYQHPNRSKNNYSSEKLDYFSELVIYTSILAIMECPELATEYRINDNERLLFAQKDYVDFANSAIFRRLSSFSNKITQLLNIFIEYLKEDDINLLKPLEQKIELEIKLRDVNNGDLNWIKNLLNNCMSQEQMSILSVSNIDGFIEGLIKKDRCMLGKSIIISDSENNHIGFIAYDLSFMDGLKVANMYCFVDKEYQQRGVCSKVLAPFIRRIKNVGINEIHVKVEKSNQVFIKCLANQQFKISRRPFKTNYYSLTLVLNEVPSKKEIMKKKADLAYLINDFERSASLYQQAFDIKNDGNKNSQIDKDIIFRLGLSYYGCGRDYHAKKYMKAAVDFGLKSELNKEKDRIKLVINNKQ